MPRPPEVYLPYRGHARGFLYVTLALLAGAGIAASFGAEIVALTLSAIAVTPGLIWVMLHFVARGYERNAAALLAGESLLSWSYTADEWRDHVESERGRGGYVGWVLAGLFALAGLVFSIAMVDDGQTILDSELCTWILPAGCGVALGAGIGVVAGIYRRATLERMAREPGVFCLGVKGMYLTGSYWPWSGVGISALGIEMVDGALLFRFSITRGGTQTIRVPIARGHENAAGRLVEQLSADDRSA